MRKDKISQDDTKSNRISAQTKSGDLRGSSQCPIPLKISRCGNTWTIFLSGNLRVRVKLGFGRFREVAT